LVIKNEENQALNQQLCIKSEELVSSTEINQQKSLEIEQIKEILATKEELIG